MVVRGKRGFTPRTFFRASSVPSEMSPKDTWTSEQLHASNHTYSYIQITYKLHTNYIQITYRLHTDYIVYIQNTYNDISFTYHLHTVYIPFTYKLHTDYILHI